MNQFISYLLIHVWNLITSGARRSKKPKTARSQTNSIQEDCVALGTIMRSPYEALSSAEQSETELFLTAPMLLKHAILTGGTGTGKTTLMLTIFRWLVKQPKTSVCLIDARGDLLDRVLVRLAYDYTLEELKDRLVVIDLRQDEFSSSFNILREPGLDPYTRVSLILEILGAVWDIGVQTLQVLRACLLTIALTDENYSLMECEPLLVNQYFRKQLLASITDTTLLRFWDRFDALSDTQRSQWVEPCLNRLSAWLSRPVLRNMFAQTTSLSLRRLLDERPDRIILVSLGYDALHGDATVAGNLIVTLLLSGTMRTDKSEAERLPVYLMLDEFENLQESSRQLQQAIQEGRRFKVGLVCSHQASVQIDPKLSTLIRNVVSTQVFYAVGGSEADLLASQIASDQPKALMRNILMNQRVGECIVVQRGTSKPFVRIRTQFCPDPDTSKEAVEACRLQAFQRFGRPRQEIEAELAAREAALLHLTPSHQQLSKTGNRPQAAANPAITLTTTTDFVEVRDSDQPKPARTRKKKDPS